jgi:hypothetical protein
MNNKFKGFGKQKSQGTESETGRGKRGGNLDSMVKRIHEAAGTPKVENADSKESDDKDKTIDAAPPKTIESVDPDPIPVPVVEKPEEFYNEVPASLIDGLVAQGQEKARQEEREKTNAVQRQLEEMKVALEAQKKETEAERKRVEGLQKFQTKFGIATIQNGGTESTGSNSDRQPTQVIVRSDGHISGADALKEYLSIRNSAPMKTATSEAGFTVEHRDTRNSDSWLKTHRETILQGLEAKYQAAGRSGGKEAITARADIQAIIMETVSDMVRTNHHPNHIASNFIDYTVDIGRDSGNGINIPRYAFAEGSIDGADWDLSNVTSLTTDAQPIQGSTVKIQVVEYGMGKPGLPTNRNKPIGVNLFVNSLTVGDIMNVVSNNIGFNYRQFETAQILYGLINSTTTVYYNKKGEPTVTPASLAAGDGCQCDWNFLTGLSAEMSTQGVPAYSNGKYLLALTAKDIATLEISLRANMQFLTRASIEEMTSIFMQSANNSDMNYNGYVGDCGDFMIFKTSTLSAGPFAAALAANTESIVGAPTAMRTGFACGAHAMGRGIAMPFNIRESDMTDFQRQRIVAWNSYEGFGALDLNAALSPVGTLVPQQTRVFKLRFTATAK